MDRNSNGVGQVQKAPQTIAQRLTNYRAQVEQARANTYALQGAIAALEEIERDEEAATRVYPAPAPVTEAVE